MQNTTSIPTLRRALLRISIESEKILKYLECIHDQIVDKAMAAEDVPPVLHVLIDDQFTALQALSDDALKAFEDSEEEVSDDTGPSDGPPDWWSGILNPDDRKN